MNNILIKNTCYRRPLIFLIGTSFVKMLSWGQKSYQLTRKMNNKILCVYSFRIILNGSTLYIEHCEGYTTPLCNEIPAAGARRRMRRKKMMKKTCVLVYKNYCWNISLKAETTRTPAPIHHR